MKILRATLIPLAFLLIALPGQAVSQTIPEGRCVDTRGCGPEPSSPSSPSSNARAREEAEARARAEAEARAREEAEAAERERVEAERKKKEKEENDAKFIRERDAAAKTLKGSSSAGPADEFGLKGSGGSSDLRDAVAEPVLKGSGSATKPDPSKQAHAWRQVHCAASVYKYALTALSQKGDYDEYGTLSVEAMKSLDGARMEVQCDPAPSVPKVNGEEIDVDKLKTASKELIERGNALAARMKAAKASNSVEPKAEPKEPAKPETTPAPCTGTKMERMRCAQVRLNEVNSKKVEGQTTSQISEEEKNRKELADLIIKNNDLEKGEISVTVNTSEEPVAPSRRPRGPARKP